MIDAIPPGQVGPQGPVGPAGTGIASVNDDGTGRAVVHLSDGSTYGPFEIASGPPGSQGVPGNTGPQGDPGPQGPQGPDGRSVVGVNDNGSGQAVIQMSDGTIYGPFTVASGPQGGQGEKGDRGDDGSQGPQGEQGPPGVPAASIETAEIHGTDTTDPGNGGNLLLRGGDMDGLPGARLELTGFVSSGQPGGCELHLTITKLTINGQPGINETINVGGVSRTFTHGILTGYA